MISDQRPNQLSPAQPPALELEREIAAALQAEFLDRPLPATRGVQIAARTNPVAEVGGDFFDVLAVEGDRIGLLVGDVSGRGIRAALSMAMTLSFFRSLVPGASSPKQVLETANGLFMRYRPNPRLYVSALYAIYDARDRTLTVANAGMPPPVLNGHPLQLKGLPIGARSQPGYREEKFPLTTGDVLVLLSDGLNTSRTGGEKLGWDRLFRLVGDHMALSAPALLDQLLRSTTDWSGGRPLDDMTALCLRVGEGGGTSMLTRTVQARHTRKLVPPSGGLPG